MQLDFNPITVDDKKTITSFTLSSPLRNCDLAFSNMCSWRFLYQSEFAVYKNFLLIRFRIEDKNRIAYMRPIGSGDFKDALSQLEEDSWQHGHPLLMLGVTPVSKDLLEEAFPGEFTYIPERDYFDYIYLHEDLATLKGKKFQSKRNFVSRFKSNPDWAFEPITKDNLQECWQMNEEWCHLYGCTKDSSLSQESCSVRCALKNFEALGLKGGLLRLSGKVVAFSIGEMLNSDTFLVHIEKAFADIQGAYPTISREFLLHCSNLPDGILSPENESEIGFKYVNREDDAGDEGLRKAKLQYHPVFMIEKYIVAESEK